jgi:hypothetical protein
VADRLGWDFLQEHPLDKNPFIERVDSHPAYQWQAFVQTPSMEPHKDLCLEQGETFYENKWVYEWILLWRILVYISPLFIYWYFYELYNNNTPASPEYLNRFGIVTSGNSFMKGLPRRLPENVNYWGTSMWSWQLILKKTIFFPVIMIAALCTRKANRFGKEYVIKAVFNRERDVVFVWRVTGICRKRLDIFELHYLERTVPSITSAWSELGMFKKDGILTVFDLRTDDTLLFYNEKKYWNIDQRDYFFKNTNTFWQGLRHKDVHRGVFINRSKHMTEEEIFVTKRINEEIKAAIQKHGPIFATDYETNYKYQLKKRIQDIKRNLIEGKHVDTSMYREKRAGTTHNDHGHDFIPHSMH